MRKSWNKGYTKLTHPSVMKISQTMKHDKINNFQKWREKMIQSGKIKSEYPELLKNGDLAELIGVVLGDGHIWKYDRTEELSIFSNANNSGFIKRYSNLVEKVFSKKPTVRDHSKKSCVRIRIYEKYISNRLDVPISPRLRKKISTQNWILKKDEYIVRYLRGLYEAEGCLCVHKPTGTYKMFFSNKNISLLRIVFRLTKKLGFHPHTDGYRVQISRRQEVYRFRDLICFRKY